MSTPPTTLAHETDAFGVARTPHTLKCCKCGHGWEGVCSHLEALEQRCPKCNATDSVVDRASITAGTPEGRQYVGREWRGQESRSMAMPEIRSQDLAGWKQDVPSIETNDRGQVVFKNDAHQRQVYREMKEFRERHGISITRSERA